MLKKFFLKTMLLLCALIVGSGTMWADKGDELAICQGTGSGYGTRRTLTDSHSVGWVLASSQTGYLGANNATNHNKIVPTAADLPVVKAANSSATTTTTGYYFYYTTTAVSNVGSLEFSYTANNGNSSATAYVVVGDAVSTSGGDAYEIIELSSSSTTAQNASLGTSGTFTYTFEETQTAARYYGFIIVTNSFKRLTGGTIKLLEGDTAPKSTAPTIGGNASFTIFQDVPLTSVSGARIYYTTDGTTPTTSTPTYVTSGESVTITSSCTIKAASKEDGKELSSVSSKDFTKNLADNTITVTGGTTPSVDRTGGSAVDDWTPAASATSGGTISYAVKSATNLTLGTDFTFNTTTGKVSFLTAYKGIIVITASVAADDDYTSASQDITLTVNGNKRTPVIAYDGEDAEISNTGTLVIDPEMIETDGDITVESSDINVATVSEYTISAVADGTTTITINTAAGTYYNAGSATFELTVVTPSACDIALTGAPVSKTFDLYNSATPQVINYTTSSTGAVSIASSPYATFSIDQANKKITVTPKSKTSSAQTITINQAAAGRYLAGSTTFSLTVNNSATSETYEKVTNAATLTIGDEVAIVNETNGKAAGAVSSELLTPVGITITSSSFSTTTGVVTYILGGTSSAWTLQKKGDTNYLSSTTVKKMALVASNPSTWAISISEGNATMTSSEITGGNLQYNYNSGNDRFTTYTSSQSAIQLYKRGKYDNVITVTNGLAQTLDLESETDLTLSATSYCGTVSFAYKSATNLTKDEDFTFDPSTGELVVDENASSGTITITASTVESATHKAASSDIVITVVGKPADPDFSGISNQEIVAGGTYTLVNGEQFTTDGTVTLTTGNASIASVSGLVVTAKAVGTTTITVSAAKGTMYNAGSTTFNITITAPVGKTTVSDVVLFNEAFSMTSGPYKEGSFSGSSAYSVTADETGWTFTTENGGDGCAKFGSSGSAGSAETRDLTVTTGKSYKLAFKCAPWSDGTNGVKVTVTGGTIDSKSSASTGALTSGVWNSKEYTIVATSTTMSFTFEKGGSENRFFLDDIVLSYAPTATVTLNKDGYATYCSVNPIDFSSTTGYTAWRVNNIASDGTITFKKVTEKIKGGQGVLLYNKNADGVNTSSATITFADGSTLFDNGSDANNENDNLMLGTTAPTYVTTVKGDYTNFGLKGNELLPINTGVIPTGKAYLPVPTSIAESLSAGARLTFVFEDDETTGISTMNNVQCTMNNEVYNLKGQRVEKPVKGQLYIVNGKKVVIK